MKTLQLIDCLTNKETKEVFVVIKNANKGHTVKLFEYLVKTRNKANKRTPSTIFKVVFIETYNPKKDYLLRNEMRLLNQLLEHFIAQKKLDSREERYLFLQSIQERGLIDLFDKEIKKEIKKAVANDDFENLGRLHFLLLQQYVRSTTLTIENLYKGIQLCDDIEFYQKKFTFYQAGELEVVKAYVVTNLQKLYEKVDLEIQDNIPPELADNYLNYLKCKAKGFVNTDDDKRKNLVKTLKLIDSITYFKLDKEQARIGPLNNLALEYLLAYDYKNAVIAFEQLLTNKKLGTITKAYIQFNCLTCLLKSGEYSKAIHLIDDLKFDDVNHPILLVKIGSVKAMAWIYVGDLKKAYNEIPTNLKGGSRSEYFYYRIVLAIIFYLEGNIDLALREIDNILQISDGSLTDWVVFCAKAFKKFISLGENAKKRAALLASINDFIEDHSDALPLMWLRDRVEEGV